MSEPNRQRPVIDLDELERQLREASGPRAEPRAVVSSVPSEDPLAELARIVGQDDPFRDLWGDKVSRASTPRVEPTVGSVHAQDAPAPIPVPESEFSPSPAIDEVPARFEDQLAAAEALPPLVDHEPVYQEPPRQELSRQDLSRQDLSRQEQPRQEQPRQEPDWDLAELRPVPRPASDPFIPSETEPRYEPEGQLPPHDPAFDEAAAEPPRRRGMLVLVAVLGVAAIGVAGALVFRGSSGPKTADGTPPVIRADAGPSKVQPENPGGVLVPDIDRQVYNRGTAAREDPKTAKVVGTEEQPVDVAQMTRRDVPRPTDAAAGAVAAAGTAAAIAAATSTSPAAPKPAAPLPGLGEPRRVKTVSVRPDGSIIESDAPAGPTRVAAAAPAVPVTGAGSGSGSGSGAVPVVPAAPWATLPGGATPAAPVPPQRPRVVSTTPAAPAAPARPRPAPAETETGTPQAPAAAAPRTPAPRVAAVAPAAPATEETASGGSFAVQLAAPGSEQEARETISRLQRRFADDLGGRSPSVRRAEVNGKTIYRVRVGNMSRDDATALCERLKGAGGQCFVARN
jgi:hypothetical protein